MEFWALRNARRNFEIQAISKLYLWIYVGNTSMIERVTLITLPMTFKFPCAILHTKGLIIYWVSVVHQVYLRETNGSPFPWKIGWISIAFATYPFKIPIFWTSGTQNPNIMVIISRATSKFSDRRCIYNLYISRYSYLYHNYSQISFRIRALFRKNRHSTGTKATRKFLTQGYKVGVHALDPIIEIICEYRQIVACILWKGQCGRWTLSSSFTTIFSTYRSKTRESIHDGSCGQRVGAWSIVMLVFLLF